MREILIRREEGGAGSFFDSSSLANSQVVIVDHIENGPFFDLWGLLTGRPTIRIHQVRDNINYVSCPQNTLFPLPGGSNPLWYSDWHPQNCHQSALLDVFSRRLCDFFYIPDFHEDNSQLKLTIIDRKATRKLHNLNAYVTKLRIAYPKVTIDAVDLAAYSFADQLEVIRNTDILVGVHGAGLIHSLFLPPIRPSWKSSPLTSRIPSIATWQSCEASSITVTTRSWLRRAKIGPA
ncbi:hypothetical protein ACLOAV_008408 [Pseudogymnoascus australis]